MNLYKYCLVSIHTRSQQP